MRYESLMSLLTNRSNIMGLSFSRQDQTYTIIASYYSLSDGYMRGETTLSVAELARASDPDALLLKAVNRLLDDALAQEKGRRENG